VQNHAGDNSTIIKVDATDENNDERNRVNLK
jgi:hypothetical protein